MSIEELLKLIKELGVFSILRSLVSHEVGIFDPRESIVEDTCDVEIVFDIFCEALKAEHPLAKRPTFKEADVRSLLLVLDKVGGLRPILLAYYGIEESTLWEEASNAIANRQSFTYHFFPSEEDIVRVESGLKSNATS